MLQKAPMSTYAITTVTYSRRALFLKTANAESLVNMLFHYRDQGRYLLHGFAVMPEHLHVLLTSAASQTIEAARNASRVDFRTRFARIFAVRSGRPDITITVSAMHPTSTTSLNTSH